MEVFSKAMLAKKLWRIHSGYFVSALSQSSLFFYSSDVWSAKIGHYPSYGWRSILDSRKVIGNGLRWKVGNGNNIRIWKDAWFDGAGSVRIISPRGELGIDTNLDLFIDSVNKKWREDLVRDVFLSFEVKRILRIPISLRGGEGELCWALSSERRFHVKDVYLQAMHGMVEESCFSGPDPI